MCDELPFEANAWQRFKARWTDAKGQPFRQLLLIRLLPFILLILFYQYAINPWLPSVCRFQPSCSRYTADAIMKRGFIVGSLMGAWRILRCNPWGGHGYDPVENFHWPWETKKTIHHEDHEGKRESGPT